MLQVDASKAWLQSPDEAFNALLFSSDLVMEHRGEVASPELKTRGELLSLVVQAVSDCREISRHHSLFYLTQF